MGSAISSRWFEMEAPPRKHLQALALEEKSRKRNNSGNGALRESEDRRATITSETNPGVQSRASQSHPEDTEFSTSNSKRRRNGGTQQALSVPSSGGEEKSKKLGESFMLMRSSRVRTGDSELLLPAGGCSGVQEAPANTETKTLRRELSFSEWLGDESVVATILCSEGAVERNGTEGGVDNTAIKKRNEASRQGQVRGRRNFKVLDCSELLEPIFKSRRGKWQVHQVADLSRPIFKSPVCKTKIGVEFGRPVARKNAACLSLSLNTAQSPFIPSVHYIRKMNRKKI